MEKTGGMVPDRKTEDVLIAVRGAGADSSSTASTKGTPSCRSNRSNGWTSDPLKDWTLTAVSVFEWILVGCSVAGLVVSFILHLHPLLWKWCVLVFVIVCSRHLTEWMMTRVKSCLERIFKHKNLSGIAHYSYYISGLGKSVGVFLWFVLILLAWYLLLDTSNVLKNWSTNEIWNFIRGNLITLVIVGALWVVKTFLVNKLSSSFQVIRCFDWIQHFLINHYILDVFNGRVTVQNLINKLDIGQQNQGVISRLLNINPKEVSAWTMIELINMIRSTEMSSITKELENLVEDEEFRAKLEYEDKVQELDEVFKDIFSKPEHLWERCRSLLSSGENEAAAMIQQIKGQKLVPRHYDHSSEDQINEVSREALKLWLVRATDERRTLVQYINDRESAIKELNELFSGILLILLVVIWSLMVGLLTHDGLVLILSQIFVFTFIFGNTAKNAFEGIIFVFVRHPYDIGDLCLVNGEEMVVERINLFTTIFRKNDRDKIFYSNSVLSALPIRNFYRGNVHSGDSLEITIEWPTALDEKIINDLRADIKQRLCKDQKNKWFLKYELLVKELKDKKKAAMVLHVTSCNAIGLMSGVTMIRLRHELIIALNRILTDMNIEHYEIRPQEVDCTKKTAKPQSTQETNQQTNESTCAESRSRLDDEIKREEEEEKPS